jgi:4-methylaminobutanoate oxidase (formaldehyde-forming)
VALLERVAGNLIDRAPGSVVYTQLLEGDGGIAADVTVTRLAEEHFRVVTGAGYVNSDLGWLRLQIRARDEPVELRETTDELSVIGMWGPNARDVLAKVTDDDVSETGFPFMQARPIRIGGAAVLAQRVTYVGELGWELYAGADYGRTLWSTLWEAGRPHGLVAAGYRAIEALRLEKGYRAWASDITPDETPYDAGLGFAVALDKEVDFIGRDALVAARAAGPRKRLRCLVLDDPRSVCLGNEPVRIDGAIVGRVTSGGYGYAVERSIAYAYLPSASAEAGTSVEVEVFGEWVAAEVAVEPLWDPTGARIRA